MNMNSRERKKVENAINGHVRKISKSKMDSKYKALTIIGIVLLFLMYQYQIQKPQSVPVSEGVSLVKCIDGDTTKFNIDDAVENVRYLAVDTPELKSKDFYAKEAADFTCNRLKQASKIELEYDENAGKQDKYGRKLAWVFVDGSLLQYELVDKGYAKVRYLYGDYKYSEALLEVEKKAQKLKLGVWSQ